MEEGREVRFFQKIDIKLALGSESDLSEGVISLSLEEREAFIESGFFESRE
jgi:hypothetical protein